MACSDTACKSWSPGQADWVDQSGWTPFHAVAETGMLQLANEKVIKVGGRDKSVCTFCK